MTSQEIEPTPSPARKQFSQSAKARDAEAAYGFKIEGYTDEEIARMVGYSTPNQAKLAWQRHLSRQIKDDPDIQARLRVLTGNRLERLLRSVWAKATDPEHPEHLLAVEKARGIIDRHAKLFGIDAPSELIVHTPTKTALEAYVDKIVGLGTPQIEEADIFDAEWDEDDEPEAESSVTEPPAVES